MKRLKKLKNVIIVSVPPVPDLVLVLYLVLKDVVFVM